MKNRSSNPSCPMVTVQVDVPAGSPWIAKKNGRIAAEKDFEKAFITLPTLLEQEARRYVSEVDERCAVTVHPPLDVLTERARYFVKIEYPMDATLNPDELKHRLDTLVRTVWAPQRNRPSEPALVKLGPPKDVALTASGKNSLDTAGDAYDPGVAIPTPSSVQQRLGAPQTPPPSGLSDTPTVTSAPSSPKEALSVGDPELRSDSDGAMLEGEFTGEGGEAEAALLSKDASGVCTDKVDRDVPPEVSGVDSSRSDWGAASRARGEKRPDPFKLEPQVHPEESFFCTKSTVVFVIETDNPLLPFVIVEINGEELLLRKGECLPSELVLEVMDRSIKWIHIVRVTD